eukprot:COSAG04_NODE_44_length_31776_cov_9.320769_4_plen_98_part_00
MGASMAKAAAEAAGEGAAKAPASPMARFKWPAVGVVAVAIIAWLATRGKKKQLPDQARSPTPPHPPRNSPQPTSLRAQKTPAVDEEKLDYRKDYRNK